MAGRHRVLAGHALHAARQEIGIAVLGEAFRIGHRPGDLLNLLLLGSPEGTAVVMMIVVVVRIIGPRAVLRLLSVRLAAFPERPGQL